MSRKICIQLFTVLVVVSAASSASACCLPPILNPFAWFCGHGGGYSQGGCFAPFCGTGCGYGGYGGGYPVYGSARSAAPAYAAAAPRYAPNYASGGNNIYTPAWNTASANCGCNTAAAFPQQAYAPAPAATAWAPAETKSYGWNPAMARQPMTATAWSPTQAWVPATAGTPRTAALPTAPIYGPIHELHSTAPAGQFPAGDITGDHEGPNAYRAPVNPPSYYGQQARYPVQPAAYQGRPRAPRRYIGVVR